MPPPAARTVSSGPVSHRSAGAADAAFIALAVVCSLVWYVPHLGFYSDDWAFLGMYATTPDQTIRGFYDASYSAQHAMRPVQLWLCAALYRVFGMEPLGYHVVNAFLVVLNPVLVYAIARELQISRVIGVPVALVYGLLPNYSTDRYWYVAFAITLSMTAGLVCIYAGLRAATAGAYARALWILAAVLALVVSALAYEVAMPLLFVATPVLILWRLWRRQHLTPHRVLIYGGMALALNTVLLGGLAAFKMQTTIRLGAEHGMAAQVGAIARHALRADLSRGEYGLNVANAVRVHFVEYGVQFPSNAVALAGHASGEVRALALLMGLAAFGYLLFALRSERWPSLLSWGLLAAAGLGVFVLGYAIFLTNYNVQFTTTGIANRSAIAAALGAAMFLVACLGLPVSLARVPVRRAIFAAAIGVLACSGVLIVNVVAGHWVTAYQIERRILSSVRDRFPELPPRSTLLLDGVCPYIGPAIVFEANWDLTGALQVHYRDRTLAANVVSPRLTAGDDGITATIYGQPTHYPYSSSLFAYHAGTGLVQPLPDAATARAWLSRSLAAAKCPSGQEGIGVELF